MGKKSIILAFAFCLFDLISFGKDPFDDIFTDSSIGAPPDELDIQPDA
jgi:hypothetical protein